jgi:two-component system, chemotaxis family, chemotaxis protein CheY
MGSRVLLVDDSVAVGRQLERILAEDERFDVVGQARNGAEAVKLFVAERPDLVVMDIVMPIMDGLQALRTILGMDKKARVVMISSVGGVGEKAAEALRMGARAVVSKPFEAEEVLSTFDRILAEEG